MARVKRGYKARRRRNKILKLAKGFHFDRRTKYRHAAQTVERALYYAFVNRRKFKRDMRKLWIVRINAAARMFDTTYSRLIGALKSKGVEINRKMLSELASRDIDGFEAVVKSVK